MISGDLLSACIWYRYLLMDVSVNLQGPMVCVRIGLMGLNLKLIKLYYVCQVPEIVKCSSLFFMDSSLFVKSFNLTYIKYSSNRGH